MQKIYLTLAVILILFFGPGCSGQESFEPQASINGEHLDAALLKAYAERLSSSEKTRGNLSPESILEHVQNMEALIAEGRARGFEEMPHFRQAVHQFKAELMHRVLQPDLVPEISRESISDEEVRAFFEENISTYSLPDLYSVTIMSGESRQAAEEFLSAVQQEQSLEDQAEMRDGELQALKSMPLTRYPQEWHEVLEKLEPGEMSGVLEHGQGYVVLRLDSIEKDRVQDFEQRKEYIRNDLLYSRYNQAWKNEFAQLREKHNISVEKEETERFINAFVSGNGQ
ncbi:peptidyl-prolyl cis-trans isomerase [Desulfonatronovibrio hydrogenovorans]|uniref:peptidylprolyl isomerase n=1 Tax=Desulfonatronovibrio hydrogenovorans TaxID=53245 RepID=UPI000490CCE9|nr:peptidylprolyl isomerase [Desulfonatronovibrio hydrogenovorans]